MALLLDDTFEMLVMAQNDKPLHGVETIDDAGSFSGVSSLRTETDLDGGSHTLISPTISASDTLPVL